VSLAIGPLDPKDADAVNAWHETYRLAHAHGRRHATPFALEEVRGQLLGDPAGERVVAFGGYVDGALVATGQLFLPMLDNRTLAPFEVHTHPEHRRRGHGSAMLEHLAAVSAEDGRERMTTGVFVPYDGPADGVRHPDVEFLRHRGFRFSLSNVVRVLGLPADEALLHELADGTAPYHRDYTLRRFRGPVPEDIVEPFGRLVGSLIAEAPSGEVAVEPEVFDEARIRTDEKVFEASGRTTYTTVAVAPDGDLVAYSTLVVPAFDPDHVFQWGTLVLPGHRGHRLGMATKVHNLLWLQHEHPGSATLFTNNAEVNVQMVAVNERMGFRAVERMVDYFRDL
jgi:GNAT superfamily N-acetyltransferase